MKKKLFSVLLCAIMVTALLPTTALADGPAGVFVGDTNVSAGGYWCNDGTGGVTTANASADNYNVHYASSTNTLTLKGAYITKNHVWDEDDAEAYESICAAAV